MTLTDAPHLTVHCRDGSVWALPLASYETIRDAWERGQHHWHGLNLYGATVDVLLADVVGLTQHTAASLAIPVRDDPQVKGWS